jgi:hypothetical protein
MESKMAVTFITKENKAANRAKVYAKMWGRQELFEALPEQFTDLVQTYEERMDAEVDRIRIGRVYHRTNLKSETKAKYEALYSEATAKENNLDMVYLFSWDLINRAFAELNQQAA